VSHQRVLTVLSVTRRLDCDERIMAVWGGMSGLSHIFRSTWTRNVNVHLELFVLLELCPDFEVFVAQSA
jgi:hypothetical protein